MAQEFCITFAIIALFKPWLQLAPKMTRLAHHWNASDMTNSSQKKCMVLKGQVMKRLIPEEKQWNRLFARRLMLSWLKEMVRFSKCSSSWLRSKNDLFKCALSFSSRSVRIWKITWATFHLFSRHYHHFKIQRVCFSKIWACPLSVRQDDSVPVFYPWVSKPGESGNRPTWWPHKV
jgi:hypothetical protein